MMEMATWEKVLLGVGALLIFLWFRPGLKAMWQKSQAAEHKDWTGALLPIGIVVLFVILLIAMVR
jgi:hypothetical protein